jgi:hypothetical protein
MTKEIGKNISVNYGLAKIGEQERTCLDSYKIKKRIKLAIKI